MTINGNDRDKNEEISGEEDEIYNNQEYRKEWFAIMRGKVTQAKKRKKKKVTIACDVTSQRMN